MLTGQSAISQQHYRKVMGRLPTGVVAVTGLDAAGEELGFIVGTFASLSLSPPLVTFSVAETSSTWPKIRRRQNFTANVLASPQTDVCRALSRKGVEKFQGLQYTTGPLGTPHLHGAIAWIDCAVQAEVVVGDHFMVVGSVMSMESAEGEPLLFQAGEFGRYAGMPDHAAAG
ncbi:flavin reductase (DIM6/NTAB) family NADH-FMN oxidoreductase RutF [Spinactinospora alkalitolerans]|uniref:Flavin reductase (DIM6/NTAB) family NADH-FMN oxidoreductase RutF n=1 Tax=Spinactinospora alkalitolerans TaxID=687207 RepID=A0A852U1Q6_9ACTN|nr:flavin reductase family protein [Spinactinospora alkalitolerans]NYE47920.1 flavin reductase (DIM6/NTAB) family NADH-FMN oxidoreductase RutF [Spinactinospora alkalitolerans]